MAPALDLSKQHKKLELWVGLGPRQTYTGYNCIWNDGYTTKCDRYQYVLQGPNKGAVTGLSCRCYQRANYFGLRNVKMKQMLLREIVAYGVKASNIGGG